MSNEIIFVTAFKDIQRNNWSAYKRSNAEYIGLFLNMARRIPYKLIVFCEEPIRKELALYDLPNVEFHEWNDVDTFYKRYLGTEQEIIKSDAYKAKVAPHRFLHPEHLYAEYNLVNHSKINFVRHVKELYPHYAFYTWLDFGFCRNVEDCPMNVDTTLLKEKVTYLALREPSTRIEPEELLRSDDVYLTGSMFIAHAKSVELFEQVFDKKIREYHALGLSDDDQSIVTQMYWDTPERFHLVVDKEWFSLFRKHYNLPILSKKEEFHVLLTHKKLFGDYVEIGVARGNFSEYLCKTVPFHRLFLVDPYKNFSLEEYTDAMNMYNMEEEYQYTRNRLSSYIDKVEFIRKTSIDAVTQFEDESLDFVYIDGNHAYEYVLEDLENYWPKVRKGGILAGDDCYDTTGETLIFWDNIRDIHKSRSFGKFGVLQALNDFCRSKGINYIRFDNQFYIVKPCV